MFSRKISKITARKIIKLKHKIKLNNCFKNFKNDSDSTYFMYSSDFEDKASYSSKNVNKPSLEGKSKEIFRKVDPKKMPGEKLLSNTPKKIRNVHKPLYEFEDESKVNNSEIKKRKRMIIKRKHCDRKKK